MKRLTVFIGLFLMCTSAQAYKIIPPPKGVARIAATLAYPDFPTKRDILTICRVESAYNPKAVNPEISKKYPHRKRKPSNGIMQVQNGSTDMYTNMIQGVAKLRENYVRLRSREGAVKAYNIGLTAYLKGRAKISAEEYWTKFKKREAELILYAETGNLNMAVLKIDKEQHMLKEMKPGKRYFIINLDEPYAREIYEILKRGQTAKGQWPEGDISFEEWQRQTFGKQNSRGV